MKKINKPKALKMKHGTIDVIVDEWGAHVTFQGHFNLTISKAKAYRKKLDYQIAWLEQESKK